MNGCVHIYTYIFFYLFMHICELGHPQRAVEILWVWKHKSLRPIFQNINVRIHVYTLCTLSHSISCSIDVSIIRFISFLSTFDFQRRRRQRFLLFFFLLLFRSHLPKNIQLTSIFLSFFSQICLRTCLSECINIYIADIYWWAVDEFMLRLLLEFRKSDQSN